MKQIKLNCAVLCIFLALVGLCIPCRAATEVTYLSDTQSFLNALKRGTSVIYVDDLCFEKDTTIVLNYDVQIIGKTEKSRIENAYLSICGANTPGESVSVTIENVIFDGLVDKADFSFDREGQSFEEMFGDERTDKRCITAGWGYFDLSLTNCEIYGNSVPSGGIIYTNPLAPQFPDSVGGCVEFAFCTMAGNSDEDGSSFVYMIPSARRPKAA